MMEQSKAELTKEDMEISSDQKETIKDVSSQKGGLKTMPFIIGNLLCYLFNRPFDALINYCKLR